MENIKEELKLETVADVYIKTLGVEILPVTAISEDEMTKAWLKNNTAKKSKTEVVDLSEHQKNTELTANDIRLMLECGLINSESKIKDVQFFYKKIYDSENNEYVISNRYGDGWSITEDNKLKRTRWGF